MNKKIIKFGDTEIEKQKFQQHESSILINNIDINKIIGSLLVKRALNILLITSMLKKRSFMHVSFKNACI